MTQNKDSNAPVVLAWQVNASTGWGLYGLHLAIQLKRLGRRVYLGAAPDLTNVPKPLHALLPQGDAVMPEPDEPCVIVSALGNNFAPPPELKPPHPAYHVGLTVFEDTGLTPQHIENLKRYDRLIAPSRWCASILDQHGLSSAVCQQGYDATVFHPAPRIRAKLHEPGWDGRVLVFSGGKLEYRKGQDIAIAAFKLFRETPEGKNAVLVTAWHNPWPATMEGIWNAGHVKGVPKVTHGVADISGWLAMNGIPRAAHLDLGQLTQLEAAAAIRECDVAIFPNRAEGATNMVLTECLGMGVPSIFGYWTGQADLMSANVSPSGSGVGPAVKPPKRLYVGTEGWMDTEPALLASMLQNVVNGRDYWECVAPKSWLDAGPAFSDLLTGVHASV